MTSAEKLQTLRDHQAWRLGADTEPPLVGDITAAIDYAIQCVEAVQRADAALSYYEECGNPEMGCHWFRNLLEPE
jgi:hypothetical protein